jgi:hypothetical protein
MDLAFKNALISKNSTRKKKALQPFFYDIISIMDDKIDNNKAAGLVWYVIGLIAVTHVWRTTGTLPSDFLLGALSVWCLRNGMVYYDIAKEEENERRK